MKQLFSALGIFALVLCLQSCASLSVKDKIDGIGFKDPGHLAWWNDSQPKVLVLPRICEGARSEFLIPGPEPRVALRLDTANTIAVFHDDSLACVENGPIAGDSLRLVVSRNPISMGVADSVMLLGNLGKNEREFHAYSLGKADPSGSYSYNACPDSSWCMREGAVIKYRTQGRVYSLAVQEHLHPESSPWARSEKSKAAVGYLIAVPVDIVLSPIYAVGFLFLSWSLRAFNPWH